MYNVKKNIGNVKKHKQITGEECIYKKVSPQFFRFVRNFNELNKKKHDNIIFTFISNSSTEINL